MKRLAIWTILALAVTPAQAQSSVETFWYQQGNGSILQGTVLNCATGQGRTAAPCGGMLSPMNVMQMPFSRSGNGDPIIFSGITTTAKQFEITKPADANAYRFVNPCNVDVRIRKVGSMSESVTLTTGTRFMARSSEVLGTSEPRFVSVIAMAPPTGDCSVELQYGRGS
ncbi:hypothetical protein FHR71_005509 [Methylobacterium sp. RAS18]|nr:hypothetical protein [Methylobacterium sp. RAS18]